MKILLILGVCVLTVLFLVAALRNTPELKAGDKAPDFKLKGSDGKEYTLKQFAGKQAVVIAWFPKAFTGGCTAECTSLRENGEELRKFNVAVFAASVDDEETNKKFAESLKLDYPILCDPDKSAAKAYSVLNSMGFASRWTFIIDKDGVIKHIDTRVNTKNHGKDLAKKLEELGIETRK